MCNFGCYRPSDIVALSGMPPATIGLMHLFVYCLIWLHVCAGSGLSFIVSMILLSAVQCDHSLIYRLHLPALCHCSLELLLRPNLLMELLRTRSGLSVIISFFIMFVIQCSRLPAHSHAPSTRPLSLLSGVAVVAKPAHGASTCSLWTVSQHVIIFFCMLFNVLIHTPMFLIYLSFVLPSGVAVVMFACFHSVLMSLMNE